MRVLLLFVVCLGMGLAVWRFSSGPHTATVPQPVDYEQTAYCLVDRESWNNFNSTLGELEHDLRFCIEVWPASQLNAP